MYKAQHARAAAHESGYGTFRFAHTGQALFGQSIGSVRAYIWNLNTHRAYRSFTYFHYLDQFPAAITQLRQWVAEGSVQFFEDHASGLDQFPAHFAKMFSGDHRGKLCISP